MASFNRQNTSVAVVLLYRYGVERCGDLAGTIVPTPSSAVARMRSMFVEQHRGGIEGRAVVCFHRPGADAAR